MIAQRAARCVPSRALRRPTASRQFPANLRTRDGWMGVSLPTSDIALALQAGWQGMIVGPIVKLVILDLQIKGAEVYSVIVHIGHNVAEPPNISIVFEP